MAADPQLAAGLVAAADQMEALGDSVNLLAAQVASERWWRRIVLGLLAVGMVYVGWSVTVSRDAAHRSHRVLDEIQRATSPQRQAQSTATVQHAITQIVNETDCKVRFDIANVVHSAFPTVRIVMPSTVSCPAFTL